MLDHFTLKVRDYDKAKAFYTAALEPLGYAVMMEFGALAGLGAGKPDFWIRPDAENTRPTHIAFSADDRDVVDAFYEAAIAAGGQDNGKPGVRADYHPTYYAAFVLDPDGHNVEVVCHAPPGGATKRAPRKAAAKRTPARKGAAGGKAKGKAKAKRGRR
jgi:catechol 2,3-dioxygenase-like lactoylglutathione lyase family enzyme